MKRTQGKPLYVQVMNVLKDRILHGVYPVGSLVPSEPQLEKEFGVSKITVRAAIQELARDGYVEKGSGKGTKVLRNTSGSRLSKLKRFTEVLAKEGHQLRKELLSSRTALTEEGTPQRLLFGQRCIRIERLYRLDGEPYIYYVHDLTDRAGDVRDSELVEQSLYGWLEERGAAIASCRDELAVSLAPPAAALAALGLPEGTPLLKRTRYSYGPDGAAVEYGEGFYATDKHPYVIQYDV